ncbi:hypothetical protein BC829DRAFT_382203 [Chytridium lagenaria]|nr:hypothetical protein BC829DRAFT_382203 [Chytridium lagenaria]
MPAMNSYDVAKVMGQMIFLSGSASVFNEVAHLILAFYFQRQTLALDITGRPPLPDSKDDDCPICLGVGLGDGIIPSRPPSPPSFLVDSPSTSLPPSPWSSPASSPTRIIAPPLPLPPTRDDLINFCREPKHVAHRDCMMRWVIGGTRPGRSLWMQVCPTCRQPLVLEISKKTLSIWEKALEVWHKRLKAWPSALARVGFTSLCCFMMACIYFIKRRTYKVTTKMEA